MLSLTQRWLAPAALCVFLGVANPTIASTSTGTATFEHVVIVMFENTNYADVIGNTSAPYFNSLAHAYGLATNYFADTHPSIGNYFLLTTGQDLTDDDSQTPSTFPVSDDNVVRRLIGSGLSWKAYAECMPRVGYLGGDTTCANGDSYYVHHVPLAYLTDVQDDTVQRNNLVPFENPNVGFAHDLAQNMLPNYSFVTPSGCHDGHDCDISVADSWLQQNIGPLINSPTLMQNTLVIIAFDESATSDANGGGRVYWAAIGPRVNSNYVSTTFYQHESTLRESLEGLGLPYDLGGAATAASMAEFFTSGAATPTASLSANPTSITGGQSSTLTWGSTNTSACVGTNFDTGNTVSGSVVVMPSATTTYSVTCNGAAGSASGSATVSVDAAGFAIGARVAAAMTMKVWNHPSLRSRVACMEAAGALGTIAGGPRMKSSGMIWWYVAFDNTCSGWILQDALTLQ